MENIRERRRNAAKNEACELIGLYGPGAVARALDVSDATVARWYSGETVASGPVLIALRALVNSQLPGQHSRDWIGWRFGYDGNLYDPSGDPHGPGDIMASRYERQLIKHLQNENRMLHEKVKRELELNNKAANDPLSAHG
jgi:hypothetical protein